MRLKNKKVLITGGAGFIGSNFVHYFLEKHPETRIIVLDKLTYAGRMENLEDVMGKILFIKGDICNRGDLEKVGKVDVLFNFAAETHVDRSISGPLEFTKTNVLGTNVLLEMARKHKIGRFCQISSDEVYGSTKEGAFNEESRLQPNSPYSASKAAADLLCRSYHKTYGLPVLITRSTNNFGPYQFPEKIIPLFVTNAIEQKPIPLYGDGKNIRDWIYVLNNCAAIDFVAQKGKVGEIYNIASGNEKTNLEITRIILKELGQSEDLVEYVQDRLGHDRRYSLDISKIKALGFNPSFDFDSAIKETIRWYKQNKQWWKPLKDACN